MAFFRGDVYSYALDKMTPLSVYLPHDDTLRCQASQPMRTLVLLHSLEANNSYWPRYTSVERYASEHNVALLIPEAEMSFYTDMEYGLDYGAYIGKELKSLVERMFRIPTDWEHFSIAGFSMGGYGALRLALLYPEEFSNCLCISGALMFGSRGHLNQVAAWRDSGNDGAYDMYYELDKTFYKSYRSVFGENFVYKCKNDILSLAEKAVASNISLPDIVMTCGREDFLYQVNESYHKRFQTIGLAHKFFTWDDMHNWKFADESVQHYIPYLSGKKFLEKP